MTNSRDKRYCSRCSCHLLSLITVMSGFFKFCKTDVLPVSVTGIQPQTARILFDQVLTFSVFPYSKVCIVFCIVIISASFMGISCIPCLFQCIENLRPQKIPPIILLQFPVPGTRHTARFLSNTIGRYTQKDK